MSALRPEADIRVMHGHSKKDVEKILVRIAMLFEVRTSPNDSPRVVGATIHIAAYDESSRDTRMRAEIRVGAVLAEMKEKERAIEWLDVVIRGDSCCGRTERERP
jgi:hypothetical protein